MPLAYKLYNERGRVERFYTRMCWGRKFDRASRRSTGDDVLGRDAVQAVRVRQLRAPTQVPVGEQIPGAVVGVAGHDLEQLLERSPTTRRPCPQTAARPSVRTAVAGSTSRACPTRVSSRWGTKRAPGPRSKPSTISSIHRRTGTDTTSRLPTKTVKSSCASISCARTNGAHTSRGVARIEHPPSPAPPLPRPPAPYLSHATEHIHCACRAGGRVRLCCWLPRLTERARPVRGRARLQLGQNAGEVGARLVPRAR